MKISQHNVVEPILSDCVKSWNSKFDQKSRDSTVHFVDVIHSKNTRVKRVHWGQTPFRVNDDPEISQIDK